MSTINPELLMVRISRYLRARAIKTERSRGIRAMGLEEVLEQITEAKSPAWPEGWGEKEATRPMTAARTFGLFDYTLKKNGVMWRGDGFEQRKDTEETSILKVHFIIGG